MKSFNLLLLLVLSFHTLVAQKTEIATSAPPQFIIKFSPINLVDAGVPGLTFSLEHQLREDHYLHHEVSLLTGMGHSRYNRNPIFGYRLRTGYRHYYNELQRDNGSNSFYEILLKFKQTFHKRISTFSRFDGIFGEELAYRARSTSIGIYSAWGKQYFVGSRFTFEWGFTLGWRFLQVQYLDLPLDAMATNNNFFSFRITEGVHSFPSTYLLFKVGYIIK